MGLVVFRRVLLCGHTLEHYLSLYMILACGLQHAGIQSCLLSGVLQPVFVWLACVSVIFL